MTAVQFYLTVELARDVVFALGKLGVVHFRDLNAQLTSFQRNFVAEIRNLDAVDSQLAFVHAMMQKYDSLQQDPFNNLGADVAPLLSSSDMDQLREDVDVVHGRISHLDDSFRRLLLQRAEIIENRHVLHAIEEFHNGSARVGAPSVPGSRISDDLRRFEIDSDEEALLDRPVELSDDEDAGANFDDLLFGCIAGTIQRQKVPILRKILWRTLRGNHYFNDVAIDESLPGTSNLDEVHKNVFVIYIHGDYLLLRVKRIVQLLDGRIFENVGGNAATRASALSELNARFADLSSVVDSTRSHLITELLFTHEKYADWYYTVHKERAIYEVLNMFDEDSTRRCLVAEGWVPLSEVESVRKTLRSLVRQRLGELALDLSTDTFADGENGTMHDIATFGSGSDDDDDDDPSYDFVAVVNELRTNRVPPTFHRTNKFTAGFQLIVDTYGISTYREVNPGLATIITFPFMFAIMFGDLGHGFIVFLVALFFIVNERKFDAMRQKDEIFAMAYSGRYIILLMGLFSMYTGLMYNDVFSKSMTLFKSGWKIEYPQDYDFSKNGPQMLEATKLNSTYPFGIDWMWHGAENGLLFTNSYKMKMSILMGYVHMNYSLMFSLVNYRFFQSKVDIIGNFIPGFLFMQSIFGYLSLTIVYKWCVDWLGTGRQPPGLLNMLINMFLAPGSIDDHLYSGQAIVQVILVLVALACVPWLLIYKPYVLRRENNRALALGYKNVDLQKNHSIQLQEEEEALDRMVADVGHGTLDPDNANDDDLQMANFTMPVEFEPMAHGSGGHGGNSEEEFNLMDVVIHQVIHTIEFCLNCVSHTASYLRLWALSLAHAQLSQVLWTMTLQNAFGLTGPSGIIMTVFLFGLWFVLTVCILVLMEGTSAMLHSLRLHWVEAMSKFFEGEGYLYEPFSFNNIEL